MRDIINRLRKQQGDLKIENERLRATLEGVKALNPRALDDALEQARADWGSEWVDNEQRALAAFVTVYLKTVVCTQSEVMLSVGSVSFPEEASVEADGGHKSSHPKGEVE